MAPKIIGIGLHKTGTSSLAAALRVLGLRTTHFDPSMVAPHWFGGLGATGGETFNPDDFLGPGLLADHDATCDFPACLPSVWAGLDRLFPSSRFVCTVRPIGPWIQSVLRHHRHPWFPRQQRAREHHGHSARPPIFTCDALGAAEAIYRVPFESLDASACAAAHKRHHAAVSAYFAGRTADLLMLDISSPDAMTRLATFLTLPVPPLAFPLENRRPSPLDRLCDWVRYSLRSLPRREDVT